MGRWSDLADWRGPTPNEGGPMLEVRGLVLHRAQGYFEGTIGYQRQSASGVSSHFVVSDGVKGQGRDGQIAQVVDTDRIAWTQRAGNGHWLSAEFAGFVPHELTEDQVEAAARLFARGHHVYGYPLQLADSPAGYGLGYHSMGSHPGFPDDWGHASCPGPAVIAQRPAILARAVQIAAGGDMNEVNDLAHQVWTGLYRTDRLSAGSTLLTIAQQVAELKAAVAQLTAAVAAAPPAGPTQEQVRGWMRAELDATALGPRQQP